MIAVRVTFLVSWSERVDRCVVPIVVVIVVVVPAGGEFRTPMTALPSSPFLSLPLRSRFSPSFALFVVLSVSILEENGTHSYLCSNRTARLACLCWMKSARDSNSDSKIPKANGKSSIQRHVRSYTRGDLRQNKTRRF